MDAVRITEETRPQLARHVRLQFDKARDHWVILGPERILVPDETAVEILQICDGQKSVSDVVGILAAKYTADRDDIARDVIAMLQDLTDRRFVASANSKEGSPS